MCVILWLSNMFVSWLCFLFSAQKAATCPSWRSTLVKSLTPVETPLWRLICTPRKVCDAKRFLIVLNNFFLFCSLYYLLKRSFFLIQKKTHIICILIWMILSGSLIYCFMCQQIQKWVYFREKSIVHHHCLFNRRAVHYKFNINTKWQ